MKKIIAASLAILAVGVLMWWLPGWAEEQANRLEQEATGSEMERVIPEPDSKPVEAPVAQREQQREIDDIPQSRVEVTADEVLAPVDPQDKEKLREAAICRWVSNTAKDRWWLVPVGLAGLGVMLIVWRKLEEARIRRVLETIALQEAKEVPDVPATTS